MTPMEGEFEEDSTELSGRGIVATIWAALALGLAGCTALGSAGHVYWAFDLFNHFYLQYVVLGLIGLVIALVLRARFAAVIFFAAAAFSTLPLVPLFQAPLQETRTGMKELRVLALNVLTANSSPDKAINWILSEDADVLVLQETSQRWVDKLEVKLRNFDLLASETTRDDNFGLCIYVKHGLEVGEMTVLNEPAQLPWIDVELTKEGRPFHLLAVHTMPPMGSAASKLRNEHIEAISQRAKAIEGPVVIAGDLNATLWSSVMKGVFDGNALRSAGLGQGLQGTWPTSLSFTGMIPIDHVLVSPDVFVNEFRVGTDTGSDHRGIVADLQL